MNDKKGILFIFSQPWCGACTKLKANFAEEGDKLLDISKEFLLINVAGDDNTQFGVCQDRPLLDPFPSVKMLTLLQSSQ